MNRRRGATLVAVGVVMTMATLLGVFAALTDSAETGTLQATSSGLQTSIDLQIDNTAITSSSTNCATRTAYVENQTVVPLSWTGADEGESITRYVCLKNTGVETAQMSISLHGATNTDTGCTGDEIDFDATSCGTGVGELGANLNADIHKIGTSETSNVLCNEGDISGATNSFSTVATATTPRTLDTVLANGKIQPGTYACYRIVVEYSNVSDTNVQKAQSDRVEWEFRFHAEID